MTPAARFPLFALLVAATACAADSNPPKGLLKENPFQSPNAPGAQAAPQETIEFAGVSLVGKRTDLIFYDKAAKKSHWIAEGETKEGISVLRYDARREQVTVKLNGVEKTLPLRKGTRTANAPAPVQPLPTGFNIPPPNSPPPLPTVQAPAPAVAQTGAPVGTLPTAPQTPPKPEAPPTPESQAKAETEARMLVSDLLEIGMAQRKAYEEAQRKAAQGNAQTPAPQPPPAAPEAGTQQPDKPNGE